MILTIIAHGCIIASWLIMSISAIPQFYLTMKLKTGTGISDGMLLGLFNINIAGLYFIYGTNMPMLYKVMSPLSFAMFFTTVLQRLYYSFDQQGKWFLAILLINIGVFVGIIPHALANPVRVGIACGWIGFFLQFIYQIPQIVSVIQRKSTYGMSFKFIALLTLGYCLELIAAFIFRMPGVVFANDVRAILMFFMFYYLFKRYPASTIPS